jgi:hypothetical protein
VSRLRVIPALSNFMPLRSHVSPPEPLGTPHGDVLLYLRPQAQIPLEERAPRPADDGRPVLLGPRKDEVESSAEHVSVLLLLLRGERRGRREDQDRERFLERVEVVLAGVQVPAGGGVVCAG